MCVFMDSRLLQRQTVHCPAKMDFFSRFGSLYNVHSMAENLFQKIKQPLTCSHLNVAVLHYIIHNQQKVSLFRKSSQKVKQLF